MRTRIRRRVRSSLIHDRYRGRSGRTHAAQRRAATARAAQAERASTCEDDPDYSRRERLPKDLAPVNGKESLGIGRPIVSGGTAMADDALIERLQG